MCKGSLILMVCLAATSLNPMFARANRNVSRSI